MFGYQTGDIITSTAAPPSTGLLKHLGILIVSDDNIFISHNTPLQTNEYGGSVIIELLSEYLKAGRHILNSKSTQLTENDILEANEKIKSRKFNYVKFNCEHYIKYVLGCKCRKNNRQTLKLYIIFVIVFVIIGVLIYKSWADGRIPVLK